MSFTDSKKNKEESQTEEATQKKTLVNNMLVHSPKKRKVDRSVLVVIWKVNDYNVESR